MAVYYSWGVAKGAVLEALFWSVQVVRLRRFLEGGLGLRSIVGIFFSGFTFFRWNRTVLIEICSKMILSFFSARAKFLDLFGRIFTFGESARTNR
jgi:hypothetical protein